MGFESSSSRHQRAPLLQPFQHLMETLDPEPSHPAQVARLSIKLFDELNCLHNLGARERFLLEAAALCHDIGWSRSEKKHHKASRDIILSQRFEGLTSVERTIVALLARYHRKAIPKIKHKYYRDLCVEDQVRVRKLAAILRIADGLDRTHRAVVRDLLVHDDGETVTLKLSTIQDASIECLVVVEKKQNLFEEVYNRKLEIEESSAT